MCGIFGYIGSNNATEIVLQGLRDLQYRGYDSWGITTLRGNKVVTKKDIGALPKIVRGLPSSHLALGHTRWATHGGVTQVNAHPHVSCDHKYIVVHNGIIENYQELKKNLKQKHIYQSQTDTELIAHYLEERSLTELVQEIKGHNAFVVFNAETRMLSAYRSGSPLVLGKKKGSIFVSSDLPSLAPQVDYIYPLSEKELINMPEDVTQLAWHKTPKVKQSRINRKTPYHMESEIYETSKLVLHKPPFSDQVIDHLIQRLRKSRHIILTGCGSAYYACLHGAYLLTQNGFIVKAVSASEGEVTLPTIGRKTIVIALSQSGETIDTLEYLALAKAKGAYIVTVTNVAFSSLERLADTTIPLGVGVEVAVASTKAFVGMLTFFTSLSVKLSSTDSSVARKLYKQSLDKLYKQEKYKAVARKLESLNHLYVLARGDLSVLGYEASLKFKEIGYLHAEHILGGEFKHGPLALIDKNTTCLALKHAGRHDMDNPIAEIRAREGKVIEIEFPNLGIFTVPYAASVIHLLSFYHATGLGHNPDRPRNLAKSVTVK